MQSNWSPEQRRNFTILSLHAVVQSGYFYHISQKFLVPGYTLLLCQDGFRASERLKREL